MHGRSARTHANGTELGHDGNDGSDPRRVLDSWRLPAVALPSLAEQEPALPPHRAEWWMVPKTQERQPRRTGAQLGYGPVRTGCAGTPLAQLRPSSWLWSYGDEWLRLIGQSSFRRPRPLGRMVRELGPKVTHPAGEQNPRFREAGTGSLVALVEWSSFTTRPMGAAQDQLARLRREEPWHAWVTMNARGVRSWWVGAITSLIAPT